MEDREVAEHLALAASIADLAVGGQCRFEVSPCVLHLTPIEFEDARFDEGFGADLIVEGKVIVELKSVERVNPAHKKQLLTYLDLTGLRLGSSMNFGEALMKDGITRVIHGRL